MPVPEQAAMEQSCFEDLSARTWAELRAALARATDAEADDALLPSGVVDIDPVHRTRRLLTVARYLQPPPRR